MSTTSLITLQNMRMGKLIMGKDGLTEDDLGRKIGLDGRRTSELMTGAASVTDQHRAFPHLRWLFEPCRIRLMALGVVYSKVRLAYAPYVTTATPAELKHTLNEAFKCLVTSVSSPTFQVRVRSVPFQTHSSQTAVGFCDGDADSSYYILFQNALSRNDSKRTTIRFIELLQDTFTTSRMTELEFPKSAIFSKPSLAWWPSETEKCEYGAWTASVLSDAGAFLGHELKTDASALEVNLSTAFRYRAGRVTPRSMTHKKRVVSLCDSCLPQLRTTAAPFHRMVQMPDVATSRATLDPDEAQFLLVRSLERVESAIPPSVPQSGEIDVHLQCAELPTGVPLMVFCSIGFPKLFVVLISSTIEFSKAIEMGLKRVLKLLNEEERDTCPPFVTRILAA